LLRRKFVLSSTVLFVLLSLVFSVEASSKMWSQTYGGDRPDSAEAVIQTSDGGYALAGTTLSFGAGGCDFWLIKTDSSGNMEWNQTYGGAQIDYGADSLVQTSDGGYVLAGVTNLFCFTGGDFWLAKTDEFGVIPEFPSWIILPLFLISTLSVIVARKKFKKFNHYTGNTDCVTANRT
jgi:hypothetical protein